MSEKKADMQRICRSGDLESQGRGVIFTVEFDGRQLPAFVIRYQNQPYAYLNQCAHLFLELDWETGEFFDTSGDYIICANHGALFEPNSGVCVNGPCYGASLEQIQVTEIDDGVYANDVRFRVIPASDS